MSPRPLAGIRVLELGGIGPGPFATMILADLGADVVRIDRLSAIRSGPQLDQLTQGKRSIAIDLRSPDGAEAALALIERAHILVEGFRPGVAERLGLGPADCARRNAALVYGRMTGWGQDGPLRNDAGHDINYISLAGVLHGIGRAGQLPSVPNFLLGDLGGGAMFLVAGVLAALLEAQRTGVGQVVDAAIVDGAARLLTPVFAEVASGDWVDERGMNVLDTGRPWYDVYRTSDGGEMSVGALEPQFYAEFVRLLELPDWARERDDASCWPALREAIADRFARRPRAHWEAVFAGTDACVAPVLPVAEAPSHPHLRARGVFADRDGTPVPQAAPRFSRSEPPAPGPLPRAGEHTREIVASWAVPLDIDELIAHGCVGEATGA